MIEILFWSYPSTTIVAFITLLVITRSAGWKWASDTRTYTRYPNTYAYRKRDDPRPQPFLTLPEVLFCSLFWPIGLVISTLVGGHRFARRLKGPRQPVSTMSIEKMDEIWGHLGKSGDKPKSYHIPPR